MAFTKKEVIDATFDAFYRNVIGVYWDKNADILMKIMLLFHFKKSKHPVS
jgi:hypothetical protein